MGWQKVHDETLGEKVFHTRLEAGLRVFVMPKPGFRRQYAVFSTNYGSIDNRFRRPGAKEAIAVPDGIAHFLEHQLFEDDTGHVFQAFADLGAAVNAYTSHTMTSYLFSTTENFAPAFARLLDFVQSPHFTAAGVEKEIGIIEQEIQMYEDQPRHRLVMNLLQALYEKHPVRIDIAGTPETIRNIDADLLRACYDTFYHPSNMAVFVVGDVEPDAVLRQVRDDVERRQYEYRDPVERLSTAESPTPVRAQVRATMAVSRPQYAVGFKDTDIPAEPRERLRNEIATSLALSAALGRSSELFQRLYDADLIDQGFGTRYQGGDDFGHTFMSGETRDPDALHSELSEGLERLRRTGLDAEDIVRAQRQAVGEFVQMFDSLDFIANAFLHYHFKGVSLFEYASVLRDMSAADVNRRFMEHLHPERAAVSIVEPA